MSERTKVVETETSGEYGEQVIVHGKTSGGVYKPIYIGDDGKVKIDPVPPDVYAIADQNWDELLAGHVTAGSAGKKLSDIPTTAMRGTDNALLAASYETERGTDNAALASVLEDAMQKATSPTYNQDTDSQEAISEAIAAIPTTAMRGTDNALLAASYETERGTDNALLAASYETERGTDNAALASVLEDAMQKATSPTYNQDTDSQEAISEAIAAIPTTAMRGTDNALLAASYETERGTNNAALASVLEDAMQKATSPAYNQDTDSQEAISEAIAAIPTTAMRGTDNALLAASYETERGTNNAALASVCTEARLAALDTVIAEIDANQALIEALPNDADIGDLPWNELLSGHVTAGSAGKKLSDIPITAMRGTDNALLAASYETERGTNNAALASVCTEGRLAALDTVIAEIDANETKIDTVDTVVDGIKVITDKLYTKNDVTPYYKTYPAGAAPTAISSSTTAWAYGSWVTVIAAGAINTAFTLVGYMLIHEQAVSVSAQLSIGIGAAASETEIVYLPYRHAYVTAQGSSLHQTVMLPIPYRIDANTRVAARIRDHEAVARNYSVYLLVITGGL